MWHWFEKTRVLFSLGVTAAHTEMCDFRWHLVTFNIWDWCALKSFFPIKVIDSCIYILLNINKSNVCSSWPYKVNLLVTFSKITWGNNSVFVYILTLQLVRCQMPTKYTAAKFLYLILGKDSFCLEVADFFALLSDSIETMSEGWGWMLLTSLKISHQNPGTLSSMAVSVLDAGFGHFLLEISLIWLAPS